MGLIKKCNLCSQKGMFLKLTNGLCPDCVNKLTTLEGNYTKILKKITTSLDDKELIIPEINKLMKEFEKFEGLSDYVTLNDCKTLLNSILLSSKETNVKNTEVKADILEPPTNTFNQIQKTDNLITINSIIDKNQIPNTKANMNIKTSQDNLTQSQNIKLTINKNINNSVESDVQIAKPEKIKNLLAPYIEPSEKVINYASSSSPSQINLNIKSSEDYKENFYQTIDNVLKPKVTIDTQSINLKDTFIINNMKSKCTNIFKKLSDSNSTLEVIAENYFFLKQNYLEDLTKSNITDINNINIKEIMESTKNMLCLRCKKTEDELFDFFNYVAIFLQTTGINPTNSDIIEVSAIKVSYGKIIDEYYTLVNPIKSIRLSVTKNTRITNDDVSDAPTIDLVLPELLKFIDNHQVVSYNSKPIEMFVNGTLKKLVLPLIEKNIVSIVNIYRIRFKNYHGFVTTNFDIGSMAFDLLPKADIEYIDEFKSLALTNSHAIYKLYEILKYRYK